MTEEEKHTFPKGLAIIIAMIFVAFVSYQMGYNDYYSKQEDIKTGNCPMCRHRFERKKNQAKVVCENCDMIILFSIDDEVE